MALKAVVTVNQPRALAARVYLNKKYTDLKYSILFLRIRVAIVEDGIAVLQNASKCKKVLEYYNRNVMNMAVQLGGLMHEAHNITWVLNMGSYLTTTTAQLFMLSIQYSEIEL